MRSYIERRLFVIGLSIVVIIPCLVRDDLDATVNYRLLFLSWFFIFFIEMTSLRVDPRRKPVYSEVTLRYFVFESLKFRVPTAQLQFTQIMRSKSFRI